MLAPISVTGSERIELGSPLFLRALRLFLIVAALAVSATVFSMAKGEEVTATDGDPLP